MTGYGKAVSMFQNKKVCAEVRSLNGKSMDLTVRVAPQFREKEMEIRAMIAARLERGKVDFALWVEQGENTASMPSINREVVQNYISQIVSAAGEMSQPVPQNLMEIVDRKSVV